MQLQLLIVRAVLRRNAGSPRCIPASSRLANSNSLLLIAVNKVGRSASPRSTAWSETVCSASRSWSSLGSNSSRNNIRVNLLSGHFSLTTQVPPLARSWKPGWLRDRYPPPGQLSRCVGRPRARFLDCERGSLEERGFGARKTEPSGSALPAAPPLRATPEATLPNA